MSFPSSSSAVADTAELSLLLKLVALPQSSNVTSSTSTLPTNILGTAKLQPIARQPVIAQQFDQNFFSSSGEILNNFVESGQIWALLIGIVLGYLIRGLTTYG